jgi:hypothetical protein
VLIGYNVGFSIASDASNLLYIDNSTTNTPLIYGDFSTNALTFNGTTTTTGNVTVGGGVAASEVRYLEPSGSGSNYTAFKAQAQAANVTYTLPAADGTNGQALTTNGSGTLSWGSIASSLDGLSDVKKDITSGSMFENSMILGHETTGTLGGGISDPATFNTAVGLASLQSISIGDYNTALGYNSLFAVSSGSVNTALGGNALRSVTTGSNNIGVGWTSGYNITTGNTNISVGHEAGYGIKTGSNNISIGYGIHRNGAESGRTGATGSGNVAIGYAAMYNGADGSDNVGVGSYSLATILNGTSNVALGPYSGYTLSNGSHNVTIGAFSMYDATTALNNVVIGSYASQNLTTASYNVVMGYDAAGAHTTGSSNTLLGYGVASTLTTGGTNVIVGATAGSKIVGGSGNVILGSSAGPTGNVSNALYIDNTETDLPLIYGNFSTDQLTFNGHVEVAIGTTTSTVPFSILGTGIQGAANVENAYLGTDVPTLIVRNSTNSADADALLVAGVGGSSAGDAYISLDVRWVGGWSIGLDNSDSDKLKFIDSWNFRSDGGTPAHGLPVMTMTRLTRRVGIGTENPTQQLEVSGTTKTSNMARNIRNDVTGGTHTVADTDSWIIVDRAGSTTITLPNAADWPGRELMFKTVQAQTVISNTLNVVPLVGGAAGTAILPATDGAWATLVSDGANWIIMQSGQ